MAIVVAAHFTLRHDSGWRASQRTLVALGGALITAMIVGPLWEAGLVRAAAVARLVAPAAMAALAVPGDPQGALALVPVYQLGLVAGLGFALSGARHPRRFAAVLLVLAATQVAFLVAVGAVAAHWNVHAHALVVRGWAVGFPLLLATASLAAEGTLVGDGAYQRFWQHTGETFPFLTGAASTNYYFESEKRLISQALPTLAGCRLLKTDLWDEAKNTRIMQWAADQGACVFGIDISEPIARQAREAFGGRRVRAVVADVRRLPVTADSFDAIYSMGTVEHFSETELAVIELSQILKPGGRLILGVPNRHDPFLRPFLVAVLYRLGLYGYGFEKSYTRRALRRMLEDAGLDVQMESGLLFMPGWLRMLDLWCHTHARPLAALAGALVQPFVWLERKIPALRRHGYLLASVGRKPAATHTGVEYVIDADGCDPAALRSLPRLRRLFDDVTAELSLRPVAAPMWHVFPRHTVAAGLGLVHFGDEDWSTVTVAGWEQDD